MPLYKHFMVKLSLRRYCSTMSTSTAENFKDLPKTVNSSGKGKGITKEMKQFFESDPELLDIMPYIPTKYLRVNSTAAYHYLVSPQIARIVVDKVMPYLDLSGKQLIVETNAGLGLITSGLLERGVPLVRMCESCSEFREDLKNFGKVYPNRVELFTKDIFHCGRYAYMDRLDGHGRVETIFRNVTTRSWTDEPFMTIIGCMNRFSFLQFLVKAVALQIIPAIYGRIQIFALMKAWEYAVLAASVKDSPKIYRKPTLLFNLLFDIELLATFPKKAFLPWTRRQEMKCVTPYKDYNLNKRYFVRINFKKSLPVDIEKLMEFLYFLKQFYARGNRLIIPTLEKWLPGAGINVMCPKLQDDDFPKDVNIFTKFRDLTPLQVLAIYREIANNPMYKDSSFMEMVQNELMKSETIESNMVGVEFDSKCLEELQEKLNIKE